MGIYRRKDSEFFWARKKIGGKVFRESTGETGVMRAKAFFEKWVAELRQRINNGEPVKKVKREPVKTVTFETLAERYIEFIKARLRSGENVEYIVKRMVTQFQGKALDDFTMADLEKMQNGILSKGLSIRTANNYPNILKRMFNKALDWELIDESVVKKLSKCKSLRGENERLRYLADEEEINRLIDACEPTYLSPIVITALNTGMRLREILKLTWDRIDLKNRFILLDVNTKGKTKREIPINDTLYFTLSKLARHIGTDNVFYNPRSKDGKALDRIDKSFKTALRKAKIVDFHFHDLRHTFASRLVMKGVDLYAVQKLLGHKSITMTMRYAHLAPGHVVKAVMVLDQKGTRKGHVDEWIENLEIAKPL